MRTTFLHRRHKRGFMTAQEIQKMPKPRIRPTVDDILARLKYRLDHPRFLEREGYNDENDSSQT